MAEPHRLTVMQLLPSLESGGVERGTIEVSKALCENGHRSIVVSSGGRMVDQLLSHDAEHISLPIHRKSPATLMQVRPLRRLIREQGVDVIHARSRVPAWAAYLAWRKLPSAKRPVFITTVHGLYSVSAYSKIMTRGQRVEVVSKTVRQYVLDHYPDTDADKLVLNYRGVDPDDFPFGYQPDQAWRSAWHNDFPQLAGKFVITLAGRITRLKGHHALIDAVAALREQGVDAHALMVGDEDPRRLNYAKELREAVGQRGLTDHVTFAGHRGDIKEVLAVSDAVVSLSTKPESFGRSVLEAVRLGRPVVGYDHGGVGEVLAAVYPHGLTPLNDPMQLAARLSQIARGEVPPPTPIGDQFLLKDMLDRSLKMYQDAVADLRA